MTPELKQKTQSIKRLVLACYFEMPEVFNILELNNLIRSKYNKQTTDCTFTRRLRELRSEGKLDYKVIDPKDGTYLKLNCK